MAWIGFNKHAADRIGMLTEIFDVDPDHIGVLTEIFDAADPRPASAQADDRYSHGGGWNPMDRWQRRGMVLTYPGDPPLKPVGAYDLPLTNETIIVYEHAFVMVIQADGSYEVARMD